MNPEDCPLVTMVVAMRNEEANIDRCLASLAAQDYPPAKLEVLVYDGESTDRSMAIAEGFAVDRPRWAVHPNPRRVQAAAWNAGFRAATGEIVGIVSGHAELAPGYVRNAVAALERTGADMVGGPVRAIGQGPIGEAIATAVSTPFGVGGARHRYLTEPEDVDTVFMGVCRRETWLRFPFDESMVRNQDDEMSYRLLDVGGRIVCDPSIVSTYRSRSTFVGTWNQFYDYGRWKVRVLSAHPRQVRLRHLAPITLVVTLTGGSLLSLVSGTARRATLLLGGLYVASTLAAAIRYVGRPGLLPVSLLALAYPVLHGAYGLGMVYGLIQFVLLRRSGRGSRDGTSD